ncbi:MAG: serine/threonine protein kinase [Acidobacteria bacterium]|nr:serine/threonine protein kinase [Acidobacteriota bacterium]
MQTVGDYNLLERAGAGALGEVYRARDTRRGRTVALQLIAPDLASDSRRREALLQDARAGAALSHPNIAALYEIGEDQGRLFFACEFVAGEPLKTLIAGQPVNTRHALDIAIQVADALADAHAADVVHGGIDTETIAITPKGNAKVLGFGLSRWMGREAGAYRSPEQALGERTDARTDIFSLGVVLFEMLTGRRAFPAAPPEALALQIVRDTVPAPSSVNPALPRELDPIVAKALAKSLDQRAESAALLAAELRAVAAILDVRSEAAEAASPPRSARRGPSAGWALLLALLGALAAAGWWKWGG